MNYDMQKSGIKRIKEQFLSSFLEKIQEAKGLVDEVAKFCQNEFSDRSPEMLRRQLDAGTKRVSFDLDKLQKLLQDACDEEVKDFNDLDRVMDKNF